MKRSISDTSVFAEISVSISPGDVPFFFLLCPVDVTLEGVGLHFSYAFGANSNLEPNVISAPCHCGIPVLTAHDYIVKKFMTSFAQEKNSLQGSVK